jgi:hypothetical protein
MSKLLTLLATSRRPKPLPSDTALRGNKFF